MSLVNPNDPFPNRQDDLHRYELDRHPYFQAGAEAVVKENRQLANALAVAAMNANQKAGVELQNVLKDFLKHRSQETAERVLELIKENLCLMEILKISDKVFPSLMTTLERPTKEGITTVFHPFHRITHTYLSLGDLGIEMRISYPRDNSAPSIELEEANTNVRIAYTDPQPQSQSELPLRRDLTEALNEILQPDSK